MNALTIYWVMSNGFTGVRSKLLNWDGSITLIPWAFSNLAYSPAGISHVNAMAMRMLVKMITNVWGIRNPFLVLSACSIPFLLLKCLISGWLSS